MARLRMLLLVAFWFGVCCSAATPPKEEAKVTMPVAAENHGPEWEPLADCVFGDVDMCGKTVSCDVGMASWYGPGYHGRRAADGSIYNQWEDTAAHRTLPFGTRVVVTNLSTELITVVTITDRGPFTRDKNGHYNRIIDLSRKAAQEIGMIKAGTARVRICWERAK